MSLTINFLQLTLVIQNSVSFICNTNLNNHRNSDLQTTWVSPLLFRAEAPVCTSSINMFDSAKVWWQIAVKSYILT